MAPIRYSLHYEDYSEHLMSRFGKLLQTQSLVDMTLMCSSHTLRVHKAVLAASSAYFQEVLQKQTGEPLIILKMRFGVLKCLVEFMYCGKTQCLEENLDELVSAAQFLKIKGLSKVTKEGLGIDNSSELPVFTPPVVISRPPQSLIDLHSQAQEAVDQKSLAPQLGSSSNQPSMDSLNRTNKDNMVVRIPFDIDGGSLGSGVSDPSRAIKPRRGRPSYRRSGGWDGSGAFGRATERALLRREQDSRKAIHQLKHLQNRHMQDYMDRVTLSQAVSSICDSETSSHNYMNMDNDLLYMDQSVSSNVLDPVIPYSKEHALGNETITSNYSSTVTSSVNDNSDGGIGTAMSQYVNALKNAGLPTDLPILFESGDGSYINVNEKVLLDMVQSSEIQYEVIEQPNIMEKVSDPSEIKSIDDLSKSIERGEMLVGTKSYSSSNSYSKHNSAHEDAINSLNEILPDNLDSFGEQQNYVVMGHGMSDSNPIDQDNTNDFSCIESDMQFFTKSMSDDVKQYYQEQQLREAQDMEQLCPESTPLDSSFNMSLLDTKSDPITQQYSDTEDLRRNDGCYDFTSQSPSANEFKDETLDYLISTPKQKIVDTNYDDAKISKEREEIIKDLMNIESNISLENNKNAERLHSITDSTFKDDALQSTGADYSPGEKELDHDKLNSDFVTPSSSDLLWDLKKEGTSESKVDDNQYSQAKDLSSIHSKPVDLSETGKGDESWETPNSTDIGKENVDTISKSDLNATLNENIPLAVGLLPLKQIQVTEDETQRKRTFDEYLLSNVDVDSKYLKRKAKYKKM